MCISKTPAHIGSSADTPLSNGRFESFTDPCGSQEAVERALQAREAAAQAYVQARPASRFWTEAPTPRTGGNRAPLRAPRPKTADENLQLERHRMRLHGEMLGTLKRREPSPSPRRQATLRDERVGVTSYKEFSDSSPPPPPPARRLHAHTQELVGKSNIYNTTPSIELMIESGRRARRPTTTTLSDETTERADSTQMIVNATNNSQQVSSLLCGGAKMEYAAVRGADFGQGGQHRPSAVSPVC